MLARYDEPDRRTSLGALDIPLLTVLTLTAGEVGPARSFIRDARIGNGDSADQLAAFERELAQRFPQYGSLQRS